MTDDTESKAANFGGKAPKGRSPAYPFLPFSKAMERAEQLKEKENFYTVPVTSAYEAWNISPKSSTAPQVVAALKHHGLLEYEGSGKHRSVKLTDLARHIILDKRPDSSEKKALIEEAALKPAIYREILSEYPDGLPSDATLETYLVLRRGFQEKAAKTLIPNLKDTISFAKLDASGNKPTIEADDDDGDEDLPFAVGELVNWESGGQVQWQEPRKIVSVDQHEGALFYKVQAEGQSADEAGWIPVGQAITHEDRQAPQTPAFKLAAPDTKLREEGSKPGTRKAQFPVEDGDVTLIFPESITKSGLDELGQYLAIFLKKEGKKATQSEKDGE